MKNQMLQTECQARSEIPDLIINSFNRQPVCKVSEDISCISCISWSQSARFVWFVWFVVEAVDYDYDYDYDRR
jgi:hypothetical protein